MRRGVDRLALRLLASVLLFGAATQSFVDARVPAGLGIILTTAPHVSPDLRSALMDEATRIWDQAGVRLTWTPPSATAPSTGRTLRLLAVERPRTQTRADSSVVGELLRVDRSKAIAMVSLGEAQRIVARAAGDDRRRFSDRQVGLVLGRAAAHEIGHYLLDTSTHASEGLMRPRFDEWEFAAPQTAAFDLDRYAHGWIQRRVAEGLPLGPEAAPGVTRAPLLSGPAARAFSYEP
ncbi:MAG: hypothetical protein AB7P99_11520 [Vicinamibacterales bacterium]